MRGIATPPRPSASSGARGLTRRLLVGGLPSEPLPRPAPEPDNPPAADGPVEPSNPAKLAEAHAMARRPDHPLHAALMNPIHPHHAHALAAYEELFRQAFAPAKPASKPAAVPGAAAKPAADGWKRPLAGPAYGGTGSTPSPASGLSAATGAGPAGQPPPKPDRAQPPIQLAQNEATSDADAGDGLTDAERMIARDAALGAEEQDRHRWEQGHMLKESQRIGGLIPPPATYITDPETYGMMLETVRTAPNLSPYERCIFMRTLTYEGTGFDAGGKSQGGITQRGTWHAIESDRPLLQKIVEKMRRIAGRDIPTPDSVKDLSIADIYDAMRAYYLQQLYNLNEETVYGPKFGKILERHHQEHPLDRIQDLELAFQLFDLEYQHGWATRNEIWNKAVYRIMSRLEREGRSLPERLRFLERTYSVSPRQRLEAVEYMQEQDRLAQEFLGYLREERAKWWIALENPNQDGPLQYKGANRARIWGLVWQP